MAKRVNILGFEVLDMSAWTAGGFPFGFRFKKPRDVFHTICCAMAERSVNADQADTTDSNILYRPACHALEYPPNPFDEKTVKERDGIAVPFFCPDINDRLA